MGDSDHSGKKGFLGLPMWAWVTLIGGVLLLIGVRARRSREIELDDYIA
jgi:hypothetical protein